MTHSACPCDGATAGGNGAPAGSVRSGAVGSLAFRYTRLKRKENLMARIRQKICSSLLASLVALTAVACASGQAPTATKAPEKVAPPATAAPAGAASTAPATGPTAPAAAGGEIRIGMNTYLTGVYASLGTLYINAMKLAQKQINEAGGVNGKKINVIIEDNQSTNPGALAALNKNLEQDKVLALLGPAASTQILAMSDAVKAAGIPMLIGGTNVTITKQGNPWLFRCRPDDSISAAAMVKYTKEDLKLTKVGILHSDDALGTGGADMVEQYSKEANLAVVRREKFTSGTKDYTAQLLAIKAAGAEVMVVYTTSSDDAALIERQYRQLGSPYKYIGSATSAARDTLALAKESAEGLYAIVDYVPGSSDVTKKYVDDYRKEYNADMDSLSAWNYDALNILTNAIKKVGEDRAKIRDAILAVQGYQGVLGTFSFTPNGDGLHEVSVIEIGKNGEYKLQKVLKVDPKP